MCAHSVGVTGYEKEVQQLMAIFHCHAQMISRSQRRSAVAAAAYRAGDTLTNERDGKTHDYSRKQNIAYTEIIAPDNAPSWVYDRGRLWNAAEAAENRRNSQTAREYEIALPNKLNKAQKVELCRTIGSMFVDDGMVADMAMHDKPGNSHLHMMLTTREINQDGLTKKNRDWNARSYLADKRKKIANAINAALERAGIDERVTDESYEKQGIDRIPTIHEGYAARQMEQRGEVADRCEKNRKIKADNAKLDEIDRELAALEAERPQHPWGKIADEEDVISILSNINNEITDDMTIEEANDVEGALYTIKYRLYDDKELERYALKEAGLDPAAPESALAAVREELAVNEQQYQRERLPVLTEVAATEEQLQEARKALQAMEQAEEERLQSFFGAVFGSKDKAGMARAGKAVKVAEQNHTGAKSALLDFDQKHQTRQNGLKAKAERLEKKLESNRAAVSGQCEALARKTVPGYAYIEKVISRLEQVREVIYNRRKVARVQQQQKKPRSRKGNGRS